jgi:hypothetical protein
MQTDKIEEMAVRQIVLEALLMATLAQVGRAISKPSARPTGILSWIT